MQNRAPLGRSGKWYLRGPLSNPRRHKIEVPLAGNEKSMTIIDFSLPTRKGVACRESAVAEACAQSRSDQRKRCANEGWRAPVLLENELYTLVIDLL